MQILHITCDYPDIYKPDKTKAIFNLVKKTTAFNHVVISLNRSTFCMMTDISKNENGYAIKYWGLPLGIGLIFFMRRTASILKELIKKDKIQFDYIHTHKLTIEGIIGHYLSQEFKKPLICTIRGNTDVKIIRHKPAYRKYYRRILQDCKRVIFNSPWPKNIIRKMLRIDLEHKYVLIPNIIHYKEFKNNGKLRHSKKFCTVFNFNNYKVKNLERLLQALALAEKTFPGIQLDIIGGGNSNDTEKVEQIVNNSTIKQSVYLVGHMDQAVLSKAFGNYAALLLPSYPETFGMVFIEALFAGIPILHAKNAGIDGYFDYCEFAISVNHQSVTEIHHGIEKLYSEQDKLKMQIKEYMRSGQHRRFFDENIISGYVDAIISQ